MLDAYIDGWQIHSSTTNPNGIYLKPGLKGLSSAAMRYSGQDRIGMGGHDPINQLYGGHILPWQGFIDAQDSGTYYQRRRDLFDHFAIAKDANGDPVRKVLTFTMPDGLGYRMEVLLNGEIDSPHERVIGGDFFLPLLAPEPQIYGQSLVTTSAITPPTGGGAVLPWVLPIVLGGSSGGNVTTTNNGTIYTWPTLTLTGALTNPYILNSANGDHFQLQCTLAPTDTVAIDMLKQTVTLNGASSLLSTITDDSTFFVLEKGANAISFSSGSTADTGTLTLSYYHAWAGV